MNQSEQINELAAALAKAQGMMGSAAMNRINPHFKSKYADLSSVFDAMRGPLSANGLSTVQTMSIGERHMILRTTLMHTSGQFVSSEYPLPLGGKPQDMGSALTYAKRYSIATLVCVASDEDDDGNAAQAAKPANANGDRIDQKQAEQITALCDEIGQGTLDALLKYKHITSLAELPRGDFTATIAALNRKKRQPPAEAAE